ncbi:MAG TPA: hypothetical protein PLO67_03465 [Saprospiraceae bacterium]|nr:hypothetical protein [Saprospiraceae bacterium]HPI06334.1 hypothetical protein [Saprospiraceae bacterium]
MKNKILIRSSVWLACILLTVAACKKIEDGDSVTFGFSQPFLHELNVNSAYVYGQGATHIYTDIPQLLAVVVDTVSGFEGGYGGHTGSDTLKILKSDITWPDTTSIGGKLISLSRSNRAGYPIVVSTNIVIAGAIANPGPTAMEGVYVRTSNGFAIEIKKVFNGVYVIDNPGGAGTVAPFPYLLYNYITSSGGDSLAFPIQENPCGGGLQLVAPGAALGLSSAEYTANYPPSIVATAPLTLSWRVLEFSAARATSVNPSGSLCQWGTPVRTFEKQ